MEYSLVNPRIGYTDVCEVDKLTLPFGEESLGGDAVDDDDELSI